MKATTKKIVLENIKLDNITDPCSPKIEAIADKFSGIEYSNEHEYIEFQEEIGKIVEEWKDNN